MKCNARDTVDDDDDDHYGIILAFSWVLAGCSNWIKIYLTTSQEYCLISCISYRLVNLNLHHNQTTRMGVTDDDII